ncbi:MAG: hypothetical protein HC916_13010 [Coleofasciculaceae cyanobacterium SM2_1_6]|nr:hypothetical protein [Coleofasciculaceae cyanobacterium SM2_1_6]
MLNSELLVQMQQLSNDEKLQIIELLKSDLVAAGNLISGENETAYRAWSPYNYQEAAQKLMSLLEQENAKC